ncbi:MAG: response regulator [Chloroflexota bacterium]
MSQETEGSNEPNTTTSTDILISITDSSLRWRLIDYLRSQRLNVQGTDTGSDFLQMYHYSQPRLVIMSDTLPDWSGLELCQLIRQQSPTVQIVFLKTNTIVLEAFAAGADEVQPMSCDYPVLLARISARLRRAWFDSD